MSTISEIASAAAPVARKAFRTLVAMAKSAARFGSSGNLAFAAGLGVLAFAHGLSAIPAYRTVAHAMVASAKPISLASTTSPLAGVQVTGPVPSSVEEGAPPEATPPTVVGKAPGAVLDTALDYDVAFFWPMTPQTVNEPVAIRSGPAAWAAPIRSARPGERLRINGRVASAPGGPWYRIRLADGRDGYFAAQTTDLGAFRRRRAVEAQAARSAADAAAAQAAPLAAPVGAPLPPPDSPPPAF